MPGPYTDPVAQVLIKHPTSGREWLFDLGVGRAAQYPFVTGVTIAVAQGVMTSMTVEVSAPYHEAVTELLAPGTPFTQGHMLFARIGYASQPSAWTPWIGGCLQQGGEGLALDANGLSGSITVKPGINNGAYYAIGGQRVARMTRLGILREAASMLGMDLRLSPRAEAQLRQREIDLLGGSDPELARVYGAAAIDAVRWICEAEHLRWSVAPLRDWTMGLWLYVDAEVADNSVRAQAEAVPTFYLRGWWDEANRIYPCLGWSPEGDEWATWLATDPTPAGAGVQRAWLDTATGALAPLVQVKPGASLVLAKGALADADPTAPGADAAATVGKAPKDGAPPVRVGTSAAEGAVGAGDQARRAAGDQEAGNQAQKGTITAFGLPWFFPPRLVKLAGCGPLYDGPYYTQQVEHRYSGGDYQMMISGYRAGTGGVPPADIRTNARVSLPE